MNYLIKRKSWNKKVGKRLKYQEERKKQLGADLLKLAEVTLILVVLSFAGTKIYYFLLHSPYFQVKSVDIKGLNTIPPGQVGAFSGLYKGENIFKTDLSDLKKNLENLPSVKRVTVYRRLPSAVVIKITERMPLGLLNREGALYALDEDGNLFKVAQENSGLRLPVITGFESDIAGGKIKNVPRLNTALALMKELLTVELPVAGELLGVDLTDQGNVVLQTRNYGRITLGEINFDGLRGRLKKLTCVLEDIRLKAMGIEYIDMRFKNIVIKPR
ncbi:MAG: FtsQ-type POTRA domain-containing protein [bacterium]